jgi:transcription termination factor NusB
MKTSIARISLCVIFAFGVVLAGCRKKSDQEPEPADQTNSSNVSISDLGGKVTEKAGDTTERAADKTVETAVDLKEKAPEKVFSITQQFQADQGKSITDVTAGAKEMAVENLRKMAEKYRDVVAEKQQQLKEMTQKYIGMPDAERITAEGRILKTGMDEIIKGIDTLKERFGAYYNALKEKAGNLTGLDI